MKNLQEAKHYIVSRIITSMLINTPMRNIPYYALCSYWYSSGLVQHISKGLRVAEIQTQRLRPFVSITTQQSWHVNKEFYKREQDKYVTWQIQNYLGADAEMFCIDDMISIIMINLPTCNQLEIATNRYQCKTGTQQQTTWHRQW